MMKNKERKLVLDAPEGCRSIDDLRAILRKNQIFAKYDLFGITFGDSPDFYQTHQEIGLNIRESMGLFMGSCIIWNISIEQINNQTKITCVPKLDSLRLYIFVIIIGIAQVYSIIGLLSSSDTKFALIGQIWIVTVAIISLYMVQTEYRRGYELLDRILR